MVSSKKKKKKILVYNKNLTVYHNLLRQRLKGKTVEWRARENLVPEQLGTRHPGVD